MPEALVWIGTKIATVEALATVGSFLVKYASTVFITGSLLYGQAAKRRAQRKARQQYLNSLENKLATGVAVDMPVRYIYGRDKVGCNIVAMLTSGANDQYRHLVCVIANHEINQIHEVYVNSKPVGYANLSSSGTPSLAGWVTANGDSEVQVVRGGVGTVKLPAGYGSLVVKASATTDFTAGTTLTSPTNYVIISDVITLNAPYNTNSYYIQVSYAPNSFYTVEQQTETVHFYTDTYTITRTGWTNLSVMYSPTANGAQQLISPTNYTISGSLITLQGYYVGRGLPITISYNYPSGTSRVKVDAKLGAAGDTYSAYLNSVCPGQWTTNHKLTGHAYIVLTLDLNLSEFQGGPPDVQVECSGKKVYDPRSATTVWSDNPALVIRDYLLSPLCKVPASAITAVDSTYTQAANDCDALITINGASAKRYTLNGVVTADESAADVLENMAQSMAGTINGADWSVIAGVYVAPVMSVNHMDDVVGSLSVAPGLGRSDVFNTVRGRYTGLETKYVATDIKPYVDATYKSLDGNEELVKDLSFPYTNNMHRCHNLASIAVEDNRNGLSLSGDFSYKVWKLRPGDRVQFTSPSNLLNMSSRVFRVTDKTFQFGQPVKLTLKEDDPTIWDTSPTVQIDYILTSLLNYSIESTFASNIFGLTAASGDSHLLIDSGGAIVSRIYLTWTDTIGKSLSHVEVQYKRVDDDAWTTVQATGGTASTYLSPVEDGMYYNIRARIVNTMLNRVGPWANLTHWVVGKTGAPDNCDTFSVSYDINGTRKFNFAYSTTAKPLDWAGMEIRYTQGNVASPTWSGMTPLHEGLILNSPYDSQALYPGVYTFAICARDTTGNYSSTPVYATVKLPSLPDGQVIEERSTLQGGWSSANGWFVTYGERIGDVVVPPTGSWANMSPSTWGTGNWDKNSAANQVVVNCTFYFSAPISVRVGLEVEAEGDVSYLYSYRLEGGSTSAWAALTPDVTVKTTELFLSVVVDDNATYARPTLKSATVKVTGTRRLVSYPSVTSGNSQGLSLVGNTVYLSNTDVAQHLSYNLLIPDSGDWYWRESRRYLTADPMGPEVTPYIQFYRSGIPAMPSSFSLDVIGYGKRGLNELNDWS